MRDVEDSEKMTLEPPENGGRLDNDIEARIESQRQRPRRTTPQFISVWLATILAFLFIMDPLTDMIQDRTGFQPPLDQVEAVPSFVWNETTLADFQGHGHRDGRILTGKHAERIFLSVPDNDSAIATSRQFATKPHMAGTEGDLATALDFLHILQQELNISAPSQDPVFPAGSHDSRDATLSIPSLSSPRAWIDVYYPVMNSPLDRSLEILSEEGESVWKAHVEEIAEDVLDPEAGEYVTAVPVFHGLSRGGDVRGKLVYANYGRNEDYDELERRGVNLTGTIVIARYGGIFRGLKVKGAQERGAVGCLIYSDLRDDGTVTNANGYSSYPYGPARNPTSVQRGSVQFISSYPGDPTTPGYPSYENSTRTDGENIPQIPSLPISAATARRLFEEIEEGGANRTIRLVNHVDDRVIPIWNVMGVIPGHIKNEVVVMGNHRDAWVMGATDPTSGTVSTVEMIRGLGVLLKKGWRPLRTIVIASWDAEEYGLIGSTEWGEDFAEWIGEHVVAYLNLDSSVGGSRFGLSASPSLAHMSRDAAMQIQHPTDPSRTLWDARVDRGVLYGAYDDEAARAYELEFGVPAFINETMIDAQAGETVANRDVSIGVGSLGSGSDYTVFLQRIGIASTQGGFSSTLSDPVYHYHSVFDSEAWQERFGDPGFHRHVAIAKHLGLQLLRLSDSIILPLNTTQYALSLSNYLDKVKDIADSQGSEADFSDLRNSIAKLQEASARLDTEKAAAEKHMKKMVLKWKRYRQRWRFVRRLRKFLKKIKRWLGIGKKCGHKEKKTLEEITFPMAKQLGGFAAGGSKQPGVDQHPFGINDAKPVQHSHPRSRSHHVHKSKLLKKLMAAARRVQAVNKKLVAFERGFISEAGIKDREWYRHLGVAPGKWLGYGATTFPGLTEAFTIEKNETLAQYEAKRLQVAIDALAETINV